MKQKNINYESNFYGKQPEFYMHIGFDAIEDIKLSIAHRKPSNKSSGVLRHTGNSQGVRLINGESFDAFGRDKKDARIYHDSYNEHIQSLGLLGKGLDFILFGNGNLGNNFWHLAWQHDEDKRVYCLAEEPFTERTYSCFIVPKRGNSIIRNIRFNEHEYILNDSGQNISDDTAWCNYGQQIVIDGKPIPLEEIIEQFYDVKHIFDLIDYGKRAEKDVKIMNEVYHNYPKDFKSNMINKLVSGYPRAKYYHSTLGVDESGIVLYCHEDTIEGLSKRLVDRGVKDSIILDQGGSVGLWTSWLHPNGGFLNASSYFRPERISTIAIVLNRKD